MGKPIWAGFVSAIVLAFICAGIYAFTERADVAEATLSEVDTIVGVDTDTTGNGATSLGTIDRCISVSSTDTFYIDLFVKDVVDLNYWEGILRFDGSIVQVTSIDVEYFLDTTPGSDIYNGSDSLTEPNDSGSFLAGAVDMSELPESGSGVLARVGIEALQEGTSRLYFTLWWPYGISGVILRDETDAAIGDLDGDDYLYFDGLVFNAIVVVDGLCPTDADLDGFTNVEESVDGSDLLDVNSTPEMCDGVDNDLDGLTDEWYDRDPANGTPDCDDGANPTDLDDDDDGFPDEREAYLATDSLADCAVNEYHSAWPLDINNDEFLTLSGDVLNYRGIIGFPYGDPNFRRRLDLNDDGWITFGGDVLLFRGLLGTTCT